MSDRIDLALGERALFFSQFLTKPLSVGSVLPSSCYLANAMLDSSSSPPRRVVEFGPGTGVFTRFFLHRLTQAEKKYWAFEINPAFHARIKQRFPEVEVFARSAEDAHVCLDAYSGTIDFVVSGLPFANIPWDINRNIINATHEILREGGCFSTFVYLHTYQLPRLRRMRAYLKSRFSKVEIDLVWRNFPPAFVIKCTK